jgi:hypothetical protein
MRKPGSSRAQTRLDRLERQPISKRGTMENQLAFRITFKKGPKIVATVDGDGKSYEELTVADVHGHVIETEQYLERITGLRVHIEQVL